MSNAIRRINKQMNQSLAMAGSGVKFNHCHVFMGNSNPSVAKKAAGEFKGFMNMLNNRACRVNLGDLYQAHFEVLKKIEAGEEIIKIDN